MNLPFDVLRLDYVWQWILKCDHNLPVIFLEKSLFFHQDLSLNKVDEWMQLSVSNKRTNKQTISCIKQWLQSRRRLKWLAVTRKPCYILNRLDSQVHKHIYTHARAHTYLHSHGLFNDCVKAEIIAEQIEGNSSTQTQTYFVDEHNEEPFTVVGRKMFQVVCEKKSVLSIFVVQAKETAQ